MKCPRCETELIKIIYGLPTYETEQRAKRGEIMLGGCCISLNDPTHGCPKCYTMVWVESERKLK